MSETIFGKYRLIAELGHGGMADVFLAVVAGPAGSGFSKLTVVKRLRQNLAEEPEFVEMLVDEARISARLNHPNVVQTNEVGSVGNQYFLAMEYLDGQPLHRIQHRAQQKAKAAAEGPPGTPPQDSFPRECQYVVLADALAGLHHAHELADYDGTPLEIVHRDVTPHNIFVTYEGQTKVVDFGIAKAVGRSSETRQGVVKGKIRYMAPEQALGQKVDRRADIFSVGIMLWEVAAGKRLWTGLDDMNIVQMLVGGQIKRSPREVNPDVPEEIDKICQRALASDLAERYQTAEEMRVDIEQYLAEKGLLVSARRKLGTIIGELFKDKRTEIRSIIEKQLAALKTEQSTSGAFEPVQISLDSTVLSVSPSGATPLSTPMDAFAPMRTPEDGPTSITDAATELYLDGKKSRVGMGARIALAAAAVVLVGVLSVVAVVKSRSSASAATNVVPTSSSSAPEPAAPSEIHVRMVTVPANARMTVDGALVSSPYVVTMPRDGSSHAVRVEAAGFDPVNETVHFDNDVDKTFTLNRAARGADSTVAKGGAPPPRGTWGWRPPPKTTSPTTPQADTPPPPPPPPTPPATAATPHPTNKGGPKPTIDTSEDPWAAKKP